MNPLVRELQSHRRRIRLARAGAAAARGAFYASLAACALLAATRIGGLLVPGAVAWGAIAAVALALALREAARPFTIRDCAIHLDRRLGLEERLSTAVEAAGPMREAQSADAAGALSRTPLPPRRMPREARLLAGSAFLLGAMLLIRTPANAGGSDDPALVAVSRELAARLEALPSDRIEFKEIARMIGDRARLEEAAGKLGALRDRIEMELLQGQGGAQARKELEAAAAGAAAISAELARLGRTVQAAPPVVVALKLERQRLGEAPPSPFAGDAEAARNAATALEGGGWAPRYDGVIRRYFGSESR